MNTETSIRHHSFPYGLQKYWAADEHISWLEPNGTVMRKRFGKRATGFLNHGHTVLHADKWGTQGDFAPNFNFEADFEIDNEVHCIVASLLGRRPAQTLLGRTIGLLSQTRTGPLKALGSGREMRLSEHEHRKLLEFLFSLVDRSLFQCIANEGRSVFFAGKSEKEVGKLNMNKRFLEHRQIARKGPLQNHKFLILHDQKGGFVFPDGLPNWIIMRSMDLRIWGRLLVPITPHCCIYLSTPDEVDKSANAMCMAIPGWLRIVINQALCRYAVDKVYFQNTSAHKLLWKHLQVVDPIDPNYEPAIQVLDALSGYSEPVNVRGLEECLQTHLTETNQLNTSGAEISIPAGFRKKDRVTLPTKDQNAIAISFRFWRSNLLNPQRIKRTIRRHQKQSLNQRSCSNQAVEGVSVGPIERGRFQGEFGREGDDLKAVLQRDVFKVVDVGGHVVPFAQADLLRDLIE